jgi:hypothetical protein
MPKDDDEESRAVASELEKANPRWIVIFGIHTRQFVCYPRFDAPRGTMIADCYPEAVAGHMRELERFLWTGRKRGSK